MLNSSTLNNAILSSSSPIFNVDNSTEEDPLYPLSSYYYLPSPLIYNEIDYFGDFLSHHYHDQTGSLQPQALMAASSAITDDSSINLMGPNKGEETVNGVVEDQYGDAVKRPSVSHGSRKRRTSKKDRHSKINTAQGLRDRRMRLSLEVARPFFKLQDMLGYDKASRTVEWLLLQSKPAIEELLLLGSSSKHATPSGVTTTMSPTSDCEVMSITIQEYRKAGISNNSKGTGKISSSSGAKDINKPKQKRKRTTQESRIEARARARKRTLERKHTREQLKNHNYHDNSTSRSNWGALEMLEGYNDSNSQTHKSKHRPTEEDWNSFSCHQNGEICQSVASYRVSMQQNIMGGPQ